MRVPFERSHPWKRNGEWCEADKLLPSWPFPLHGWQLGPSALPQFLELCWGKTSKGERIY